MSLKSEMTVPCLTTSHPGPLSSVEVAILQNYAQIEDWLKNYFVKYPAPVNTSVDLRNSFYKIVPVDTNLFPAGFNNLNQDFMPICVKAVALTLQKSYREVLIIPENHTRNKFYFQSLSVLQDIFLGAGFKVRFGNLDPKACTDLIINVENHAPILLEPLVRVANKLGVKEFFPKLILLNNDLSAGIPEILKNTQNLIEPPPFLGWSRRLKSKHFQIYKNIADEFAELINIDSWLINPLFAVNSEVDFMHQLGLVDLAQQVDTLIHQISIKYTEYRIQDKPYVVIKADNGTYGMSVMRVYSGQELLDLNRKKRTRMSTIKGNQKVSKVMLQEGVYSYEKIEDIVSEPVIYLLGQYVIGGFYRMHTALQADDILNSPGMSFQQLEFLQGASDFASQESLVNPANRFYVYGVIARLAALAAAQEKKEIL